MLVCGDEFLFEEIAIGPEHRCFRRYGRVLVF